RTCAPLPFLHGLAAYVDHVSLRSVRTFRDVARRAAASLAAGMQLGDCDYDGDDDDGSNNGDEEIRLGGGSDGHGQEEVRPPRVLPDAMPAAARCSRSSRRCHVAYIAPRRAGGGRAIDRGADS
ncbi:hypothetical protein HK405_002647, partial [Cladochytrium tenue]